MYRAIILTVGFVAMAVLVQVGATMRLDRFGIAHLQPLSSSDWTYFTLPADPLVTAGLVASAFLVLRRRGRTLEASAWAVAFAVGLGVEAVGKLTVDQTQFNSTERVFDVVSLPGSFPSGHAMRALLLGAIAASLWPRLRGWAVAWALATAVLVELTGAHVISDVVGGALAGAALATVVFSLTARTYRDS